VYGQYWVDRCRKCGHEHSERLPAITKKIIYLDQCALSHILSGREDRWKAVHRRLLLLSHLEVVTCPYSPIHEDESLLAEHSRDQLKALYRQLSGGNAFRSPFEVEQAQLLRSIRRFLGQGDVAGPAPAWSEFCVNDPHRWTIEPRAYADFPPNAEVIGWLEAYKQGIQAGLDVVAKNWRDEDGQRFEDDVKREAIAFGRSAISAYRQPDKAAREIEALLAADQVELYRQCRGAGKFNAVTPPGIQESVRLVHALACVVHAARPDEPDPVAVVDEFFGSEEAIKGTPFLNVGSRLWACVAEAARNPKGARAPTANDDSDLTAISHYGRYCNAIVVDNYFRDLASQPRVRAPYLTGVAIFSARTLGAFVDYLDCLLTTIPTDHRLAIKEVYPYLGQLPVLATAQSQ
jgi:hypothetical protein